MIKTILLTLAALLLGVASGGALAVAQMRAGRMGGVAVGGPWKTGVAVGTAQAGLLTRATVALGGLLALPPREARYLTATTDSAGAALDGRCRYRISGGAIDARWWSITVYDDDGYLIDNPANSYSLGSAALPDGGRGGWAVEAGPGAALPTGGLERFELTLRAYHPRGELLAGQPVAGLPTITKVDCA